MMTLLEALQIVYPMAEESAWDEALAMSEGCMDDFYQEQEALDTLALEIKRLKSGEPKR